MENHPNDGPRMEITPRDAWPETDQVLWFQARQPAGYFDSRGDLHGVPLERLRVLEAAYGRWIAFLNDYDDGSPPYSGIDRFGQEETRAYLQQLAIYFAPCTVRAYLMDLVFLARTFNPDGAYRNLEVIYRYACRMAKPETSLAKFIVPVADLHRLGLDLMASSEQIGTEYGRLISYRDGLMIALLAACPVRIKNFASIEIGNHLLEAGDGFTLVFPGSETKNRRPLELPVSASLVKSIKAYMRDHRLQLINRDHEYWLAPEVKALWISDQGKPISVAQVRERIKMRTQSRFGFAINPHSFRHIAATSIASQDPEHVGIIRPVLGHASLRSGETFYNRASSLQASRRHQDVIQQFRDTKGT